MASPKVFSLPTILSRISSSFSLVLGSSAASRSALVLPLRTRLGHNTQQAAYVTASKPASAAKDNKAKSPLKKANTFKKVPKVISSEGSSSSGSGKYNEQFYKAAPIVSLDEFQPEIVTDKFVTQMLALPNDVVTKIERFGYPKFLDEEFAFFNKASLIVRKSTVDFINIIDNAALSPNSETRLVLTGQIGCGKSALLLQVVSFCLSRKWIVIYVPRAINYVNSTYPYSKAQGSDEFVQPTLASTLLQQIKAVNGELLNEMIISKDYAFERHSTTKKVTTLSKLIDIGIKDQYAAQKVFEAFLQEVGTQKETPVLLAVDELNAFFINTNYNDTNSRPLPASRLSLPRTFLDYFSGKMSLAKGAVIGAVSDNFAPARSLALNVALGVTVAEPYTKLDKDALALGNGLKSMEVPAYSKEEAKAVLDYYSKMKVVYQEPREELLVKRFISTGGNPRKFYTACVKRI